MASALVTGLAAPLRELQALVGTGTPDATVALAAIRTALADVATTTGRAWHATRWEGDAASAAASFTEATVSAVDAMAVRAGQLGTASADAADAVARARTRLQTIVDDFEARAAELESDLDDPGASEELLAEARRALDEAQGVIDGLRAELDGHQAAVDAPAPSSPPRMSMPQIPQIPTVPMGGASGLGSALGNSLGGGSGSPGSGSGGTGIEAAALRRDDARPLADPGMFGSGVDVRLPDGSTATAPNAIAASAVRHALTQLGVPYDWGGTTPGVGLDCSGLTQWAYHEAGLELPRLAQEQDIGSPVSQATLRPGDLAVWDGHVAMIVGNGVMVEAGDPVKLSPIRTSNAGQGFQGFWRPTA